HVTPARNRIGFDEVSLHDGYLHHQRVRHDDPRLYDDYRGWLSRQPGQPPHADYADDGLDCNSVVARPWPRAESLHPTNWVVTEAIDFLYRRDPTVPFLLNLSFHRPHPPYDPPQWAFDQYLSAPQYEPVRGDWASYFDRFRDDLRPDAPVARYDPVTLQRARAGYYGNMSHIDQQVQRFVDALTEFGLAPDTWICFTSDHGELLGDHDLWRKSLPYEGSSRVPLLLTGPDSVPGVVCDAIVELRDVMPTLLSLAGLSVPDGLDGRDLTGLARGERGSVRSHLHGEHDYEGGQSVHAITDERFKYVWFSGDGREQLFDMAADPLELRDLAGSPSYAEELAHRRELL
ncbi:MAG: sulfatase-like hydrolase/transferase, partial [Stackebrandtia sp.]